MGTVSPGLWAQPEEPTWKGRLLADVLEEVRAAGLPLVYSSRLITPELRVEEDPPPGSDAERVRAVLAPHGLDLRFADGLYLVVRPDRLDETAAGNGVLLLVVSSTAGQPLGDGLQVRSRPALSAPVNRANGLWEFAVARAGRYVLEVTAPGHRPVARPITLAPGRTRVLRLALEPGPAELETLSVSASRYILFSGSPFFIDQRAIQALPDLGEDPLRSVHRLPGAAASGLSSRSHFRGGEHDETAIYLNGLRLIDPFHIRDYNNIFSTIDARAIAGVEAFTGGFPANYGDSMSGVLLLDSQRPDQDRRTELGLSIYNTSLLLSGRSGDGAVDGLFSARRSNLDVILNDDLGKPDYFDVFAEVGWRVSDRTRLALNGLYADDRVVVITESDPAELEKSVSRTRNRHLWMLAETEWTPRLASATVVSSTRLENRREAEVNDPEQLVAAVRDERTVSVWGLRSDWRLSLAGGHEWRWGLEFDRLEADYDYLAEAEYFEFFEAWPGIENPRSTHILARPSGEDWGAFTSLRWRFNERTAMETGLRFDRQTYTGPAGGTQWSPRMSLRYGLRPGLDLRLSWGRYHQAQPIQRLQVEDGVDRFFEPQRAEHWIAGLHRTWPNGWRLRIEAYRKNYDRLKPRFENLYDALALIPELEPDRVRLAPSSARARGLEMTVEFRGEGPLNGWATWSWSKATDTLEGRQERRSWDQRHALQGGLAWERGLWEIGLAANVHTGWPITGMTLGFDAAEDRYVPVPGPRNAERLGTFATVDFRVARRFDVRHGALTAFFEVTNLTNRRNECCVDFDLEDEDDGVALDRTVDHWLPVIPAIGVYWEF